MKEAARPDSSSSPADGQLPPWEKVLWKQQPYPDNYIPDTFLQDMVLNAEVPVRQYWPVALASCAITQQLAVVAASVGVAIRLQSGSISATQLLGACIVLLISGYAVCAVLGRHVLGGSLAWGIRQGSLLVGGVALLSPLLRTLSATIAGDSIAVLCSLLMLAHLFLHDYNFVNIVSDRLSGALALAAAVLASVLLSSAMPSELHVFSQVLFSLQLFLLSPFVRRYIRATSVAAHVATTVCMVAAAAAILDPLSRPAALMFVVVVLAIALVCPALLVSIHKYKAKISGPWDEAVPAIPQHLHLG